MQVIIYLEIYVLPFDPPEAIQRAIAVFATLSNINYTETETETRQRHDRDTNLSRTIFFQVARHVVRHSVAFLTSADFAIATLFSTRSKDLTPLGQANHHYLADECERCLVLG